MKKLALASLFLGLFCGVAQLGRTAPTAASTPPEPVPTQPTTTDPITTTSPTEPPPPTVQPSPSPTPSNQAPTVNAGADVTARVGEPLRLVASVGDDGKPGGILEITWTKVSGPGIVNFSNTNVPNPEATFSLPGTYMLLVTASDGALTGSDDINVTVTAGQPIIPPVDTHGTINIFRKGGVYTLKYNLPAGESGPQTKHVLIEIVNTQGTGAKIATLFDGMRGAGDYTATWDGRNSEGSFVAADYYLVMITIEGKLAAKKPVIFIK